MPSLVLDELLFEAAPEEIHYWRDKQKHEIDFVWTPRGRAPVAIECKWRASRFDPTAMQSFATLHPKAALWLVAEDARRARTTAVEQSMDWSPVIARVAGKKRPCRAPARRLSVFGGGQPGRPNQSYASRSL
jgi:hypothetical protein